MARLENCLTGEVIVLHVHHTFGRYKTKVETVLTSQDVSKVHASICWEDQQWKVVDHSRNGTWVNKNRLVSKAKQILSVGDVVWFGGSETSAWKVLDVSPPKPMLVSIKPQGSIIELERLCVLPDEEHPELTIYLSEYGDWLCEDAEETRVLQDGDIIQQGQTLWKFVAVDMVDSTLTSGKGGGGASLQFRFLVSPDEEHVTLQILQDHKVIDLGERVHHYPLLILARQRLADAQQGFDVSSQGWIDFQEFCSMLRMDYFHLNTQIYRARKQILHSLPNNPHLPKVVERRSGSLRFGSSYLFIQRGDDIEGQLTP